MAASDGLPSPDDRSQLRPRFALILALSACVHLLLFILFPDDFWQPDAPHDIGSLSIEIVRNKPEPAPQPHLKQKQPAARQPDSAEQRQHLPRNNAEKTDLRGTDFDAPVEDTPVAGESKPTQPHVNAEDERTRIAEGHPDRTDRATARPQVTSNRSSTSVPEKQEKKLQAPQGMKSLSDQELAGARAGSKDSEIERRRIQMVNHFLARMQIQVDERFRRPLDAKAYEEGIIAFELDPSGYLLSARIVQSSGNTRLDASALQAIRAVPRFEVPDSPIVAARYYRYLTFRYTGE
ncbi:TonB family protein [Marinobacter halodurans]|uniref:TonB family protein n=1 Tax=Marinobacter halodurans TaxID=2528979 RepID=A0ABY1ZQJ6_9GAMM|nr:energy transducer TonB [Marinobacter halodurans]TBW59397.1 TonB family protein [Marinobacter halodurans]